MAKILYTWEQLEADCRHLAKVLHREFELEQFVPQVVLGIARGGLFPATLLAHHLGVRAVGAVACRHYQGDRRENRVELLLPFPVQLGSMESWPTLMRALVVDDVADTGKTLEFVLTCLQSRGIAYRVATLHYKEGSLVCPTYFAHQTSDWIVYPWERD